MKAARTNPRTAPRTKTAASAALPGQTVLVLQGGGALGAYQLGVFDGLHEAGLEPDWVVGTSIGAINGALIAGNRPEHRQAALHAFWDRMTIPAPFAGALAATPAPLWSAFEPLLKRWSQSNTITQGLSGFFRPSPWAMLGSRAQLGIERASYYDTTPLRETLDELVDWEWLSRGDTRLTVGAVNARTGAMRYFDSRRETLTVDHVMASGALPPAFPAVRIDGEPYWDGGIYSNTPMEVVLDDAPRRDSVIFSVKLWNPHGDEPGSLWQIQGRQKDIQFSSRHTSHVAEQQKLHRLRHIIRELVQHVPAAARERAEVAELAAWGCGTTMHVVSLMAPRLAGEDQMKDIDFTADGVAARRAAGARDAQRAVEQAPWRGAVDPREGVVIHELA